LFPVLDAPEWFEWQNTRALGQFILGDKHKFEYGKGVAKDTAEAVRLHRLAAAQGNAAGTAALKRLGA
jgi:TPR repeat protein